MSPDENGITDKSSGGGFDNITRIIHLAMAVVLTLQMCIGLLVHDPQTRLFLYLHEYVGILSALVIFVEWLWIYTASRFSVLFPWNRAGISFIVRDLRNLGKHILPEGGDTVGLSGFWHGIGILSFTFMALTGIILLFVLPGGHSILGQRSTDFALYTRISLYHKLLSYVAWMYLAGHVLFAILHQLAGNNVLGRIFLFTRKQ
ncbi:cytochrome b/b6 domain-containing protein [Acidithiobacillus ferrianus]|uniref:Cytochrome b/b6 domain-containing protein n=2 Tax=Acidithiobacillus ferrianus TaxID=2678518 RepID=A0A845UAR0_9PROT|nr:cytochrome b/b6 domain-containing protein [Acidithiobacillus ferrianus]NDU42991.1 cytochrome b/b6 domain-containing protein [Acidithiobacillus ferrianus]